MGEPIQIEAAIRSQIITHAQATFPNEGCGLLGSAGSEALISRMVCVPSKDPHPRRFTMEPHAQIQAHLAIEADDGHWRAIWHSHPTSAAYPSATDTQESRLWPGIIAIIVSLMGEEPVIRAFRIHDGQEVVEHPIQWVPNQLP